jgi:hypothetical protein
MAVFEKLASVQGIKSDVPNQELAQALAADGDTASIRECVEHLHHKEKRIQSDCIKVLYEIGYLKPALIVEYVDNFLALLTSRNNRLVWGAMIALSTIAELRADEIFASKDRIMKAIEEGSVITVDAGIKALSGVAAADTAYNATLFPYLLERLRFCRPKSVAQYAESIVMAVTEENIQSYIDVLNARKSILKPSQLKRVEKIEKRLQ